MAAPVTIGRYDEVSGASAVVLPDPPERGLDERVRSMSVIIDSLADRAR
ncbi:MAG: hypothetical protein ACRCXL_02995 [Dermatophilaceae bacterium]